MSRLVVLDRDGTIIEERPYLSDPQAVTLLPNAARGLRALQRGGFRLVVVSNQPAWDGASSARTRWSA